MCYEMLYTEYVDVVQGQASKVFGRDHRIVYRVAESVSAVDSFYMQTVGSETKRSVASGRLRWPSQCISHMAGSKRRKSNQEVQKMQNRFRYEPW